MINIASSGGAGEASSRRRRERFFARDGLPLDCETWTPSVNHSKIAEIELNLSLRLFIIHASTTLDDGAPSVLTEVQH